MITSDVVFPAGRAKKKAKSRRRGSRQRVTMVTISEPDLGLSEEPEDTSLDREETRKRRFGRCPFYREFKRNNPVQNNDPKKYDFLQIHLRFMFIKHF